ncbi:MAG: TMEM175 family protein [Chloroflexota bacterium]|jgi:uncharacterized membrane protein
MADRVEHGHRPILPINRLEAFSDGVFAIAITLLVLELALPAGSEANLLAAFLGAWPAYLAYIVSFSTIGAAWLGHATITSYMEHVDPLFVRLNLLLLLAVSFIPFPTKLVGEHIHEPDAERVAVTILGINLLLAALIIDGMWRYAVRSNLVRALADDEEMVAVSRRLDPGILGYVAFIAIGIIFPIPAVLGYFAIAIGLLLPPVGLPRRRR